MAAWTPAAFGTHVPAKDGSRGARYRGALCPSGNNPSRSRRAVPGIWISRHSTSALVPAGHGRGLRSLRKTRSVAVSSRMSSRVVSSSARAAVRDSGRALCIYWNRRSTAPSGPMPSPTTPPSARAALRGFGRRHCRCPRLAAAVPRRALLHVRASPSMDHRTTSPLAALSPRLAGHRRPHLVAGPRQRRCCGCWTIWRRMQWQRLPGRSEKGVSA
mmetsp:Transcript_37610/g.103290  ORF Transcript_37610/g.103290 Transcript_37610/m.103290 type:complete len:216 (-) Transcript_37610:56-703(-)